MATWDARSFGNIFGKRLGRIALSEPENVKLRLDWGVWTPSLCNKGLKEEIGSTVFGHCQMPHNLSLQVTTMINIHSFIASIWPITWEYVLTSVVKVSGLFYRRKYHLYCGWSDGCEAILDSRWFRIAVRVVCMMRSSTAGNGGLMPELSLWCTSWKGFPLRTMM